MAVSRSLRRLHLLRKAEEQQKESLLQSSIAELRRIESALELARERASRGRVLVLAGVQTGDLQDRICGLEEIAAADRLAKVLHLRIKALKEHVERMRQEFIAKRMERRQAETLLESAMAQDDTEGKRRSQIELDEWHRTRRDPQRAQFK